MLEADKAQTVDLMKYILSYASNPSVSLEKTDYSIELVESSVRNLLSELAKVIKMKAGDWICPRYVNIFVCINSEAVNFITDPLQFGWHVRLGNLNGLCLCSTVFL